MNHVVKVWKAIQPSDREFFDKLETLDRERFTDETNAFETYIRSNPIPAKKKSKKNFIAVAPVQQPAYQSPQPKAQALNVQNSGMNGNMSADQMSNP
jgi:hypothetical protein